VKKTGKRRIERSKKGFVAEKNLAVSATNYFSFGDVNRSYNEDLAVYSDKGC